MSAQSAAEPQAREIHFDSGSDRCAADLWLPAARSGEAEGPVPIVVMAHGLGGTRDMGLAAYAQRFARAGLAALVFDYRHFGGSGGQPRQLLSIPAQLADWEAAIAFARSLPDVDGARVAIWGTSFAGGHVLELAGRGARVAAVVSQCPFTDGLASSRTLGVVSTAKVGVRAAADLAAKAAGRPPVLVETAGEPGSAALMTAPDALPGYRALCALAAPGGESRVAARIGLQIGLYRPGRRLAAITAPTLIQVCDPDTVAPTRATRRHIERAANPRIRATTHHAGHFDIYLGEPFERVVAEQVAFLERELLG